MLNQSNLHGVWAALTTPFGDDDCLDDAALRENVRRLVEAGVDGVYTTDADGEFYSIDFDEYRRLVDVIADEGARAGVLTQVGVTWNDTKGVTDRIRHAASAGIDGVHVGHPIFMDMTPDSWRGFWSDVAESSRSEIALIHYNSRRLPNYLQARMYAELEEFVPNLVGTKQVTSDAHDFANLVDLTPRLRHFCGEQALVPLMSVGASGVYSWLANFNARFMVEWYRECANQQWEAARRRQTVVNRFIRLKADVLGPYGSHGIVNKAVAAASPFLLPRTRTRKPYLQVPDDVIDRFRHQLEIETPELVWNPDS